MKINISLDDELLTRIDKYADAMYMTRSGFISSACAQVLMVESVKIAIQDISLAIRKIADEKEIDDETAKQLEDFERMVKMISGSR